MMTPREVLMSNTHLEPQKIETHITTNKKCKCSSSNIKFLDNAFGKAGNNQCSTFVVQGLMGKVLFWDSAALTLIVCSLKYLGFLRHNLLKQIPSF